MWSAKAVDNFDINLKQRFKHDYKTTPQLVWILFNEDAELAIAGVIAALLKTLQ